MREREKKQGITALGKRESERENERERKIGRERKSNESDL